MTTLRRLMLPLALCSVLALGACGSSPSDGSSGSKAFPQLVNGRFTEDMCDVLTHEDFAAVGRDVETGLRDTDPLMAPNTVTCSLQPGVDRYLLNLQPDTESAQLFFQYERQAHDDFMHRAGMTTKALQQNVVAQADESWFDIDPLNSSGSTPGTVLTARKGSLLVTFNQGASGEGAQEDVAKLVGTILERLPEVASVQTGHAHTLTFKVTGKGTKTADILHADRWAGSPRICATLTFRTRPRSGSLRWASAELPTECRPPRSILRIPN